MKGLDIKKNVCGTERKIRIYSGLILMGLHLTKTVKGNSGKFLFALGADLLGSGLTRFCLVNKALGRNSCE